MHEQNDFQFKIRIWEDFKNRCENENCLRFNTYSLILLSISPTSSSFHSIHYIVYATVFQTFDSLLERSIAMMPWSTGIKSTLGSIVVLTGVKPGPCKEPFGIQFKAYLIEYVVMTSSLTL
jgi:hypothetical protein